MPSSRATIAAWHVRPPRLVTMAAACFHRLPIRTGRVGNQHFAGTEVCEIGTAVDSAHRTVSDFLADRASDQEDLTGSLQTVAFEAACSLARRDGLRASLDDIDLAVDAVLRPFDVHRNGMAGTMREMVFDAEREVGDGHHVAVYDAEAVAVGRRRLDIERGPPALVAVD